jgi:hypothetical protein
MHKKINAKRTIMVLALALSGMTLLSGCGGGFTALPDEERYQHINEVKDSVDLDTIGEVTQGGYDAGDGVFSPSHYRVRIEGDTTSFITLKERVTNLPGAECRDAGNQISCKLGQADILVTKKTEKALQFEVVDVYSGRNPE